MTSASDADLDSNTSGSHSPCREARQLRERQNSFAPICRLPAEILAELFHLIRNPQFLFDMNMLRHTCRALNNISLSTPRLWSYVDLRWHPEWSLVCSQRAHPLPLSLSAFDANALLTENDISVLFHRSSVIHWNCDHDIEAVVADLLNSSAPLIHQVHFGGPLTGTCAFSLTPRLLGGECSNLVTLTIERVELQDAPPLPSLQTLCIRVCDATLSTCRQIIQCAPNLEHLTLDSITLEDDLHFVGEITPIDLPHLRSLSINQAQNETLPFLHLLPNPSQRFSVHAMQDGLGERAIWTGTVGGEDEVIPTRLRHFWQTATGETQIPPMMLSIYHDPRTYTWDNDNWTRGVTYHMYVGTNPIAVPQVKPSLSWSTQCQVTEPHPLLDLVINLDLWPKGGRVYLGDPDLLHLDLFKNLEYVHIQDAYLSDELWERYGLQDFGEVAKWMARRVEAGKHLKILEIGHRCHKEVKSVAQALRRLGLVENIRCNN